MTRRLAAGAFLIAFPVLALAQTIDLSGVLKDRYTSNPVTDAEVTLVGQNLHTRTDAQGIFRIQRVPSGTASPTGWEKAVRILPGRGLAFLLDRPGPVTLRVFDSRGAVPGGTYRAVLEAGHWEFHLGAIPRGVYFLRLESGGSVAMRRISLLDMHSIPGNRTAGFVSRRDGFSMALAKAAADLDTLRFTKAGYFPYSEPVTAWIKANLAPLISDTTTSTSALTTLGITPPLTFQPPYVPGYMQYVVSVSESVATLQVAPTAAPANPDITVSINYGEWVKPPTSVPLALGDNTLRIQSLSKDGKAGNAYHLYIHRAIDTAAALKSLQVSNSTLVPPLKAGITDYKVQLGPEINSVFLVPTAYQPLAEVRVAGQLVGPGKNSQDIPLVSDSTRVEVEVTSPGGAAKTLYRIDFIRKSQNKPTLASIAVEPDGQLNPPFNSSVPNYIVWLPAAAEAAEAVFTATGLTDQIQVTGRVEGWVTGSLRVPYPYIGLDGHNYSSISVRKQGDTAQTWYNLQFIRDEPGDATLARLTFEPSDPMVSFSRDKTSYSPIYQAKDSILYITPMLRSKGATMTFDGVPYASATRIRLALKTGKFSYHLVVTSADGVTSKTFSIMPTRLAPAPVPTLSGPSKVFAGTKYAFQLALAGGSCSGTMPWWALMHWGDGTTSPSSNAAYLQHSWTAPGTYTVFMTSGCKGIGGTVDADTSNRLTVTVADPAGQAGMRAVTGPRMASETWSPDTVYHIVGKTLFEAGTTLTILPGTKVQFATDTVYLLALGDLQAIGTPTDSIRFEGGQVRVRWNGPTTFNPDGSYKAGPRFEYVSYQRGSIYADHSGASGGSGFYMTHSTVPELSASSSRNALGTYIEKCRFNRINGLNFYNSRILNSYVQTAEIGTHLSYSLIVNKCDIGTLTLKDYDFTNTQISGNTIRALNAGYSKGQMHGNNLLPSGTFAVKANGTNAVNLQDNFWGDAGTTDMVAKGVNQNITILWDYFDNIALGKVDYSLWKSAPIPDAKPDW